MWVNGLNTTELLELSIDKEKEEKAVKLTPDLEVMPGDTVRIGERYF